MSFVLSYVGGPRDGENEDRRGAPQVVPYLEGETPGVYRMTSMKKKAVTLVWVAKPKTNVKASHGS